MTDTARKIELAEYASIMGSTNGRAVLMRVLERTGVDGNTFNADPYLHAHNAGQRSTGVWLRQELMEADLPLYLKMITENIDGR